MYSERLRRGKAEEDLETLASTDALTGLGNMRAFSRVCQGVPRDATTMLIIDVDDFKVFNDTYGHYAGNRILSCIGQALEGGFGSHAPCFRMGGDEFAVISDSQDEKGLLACLEDATARLSCLADGMGLEAPTLSVGFSSVQTDGAKTYEDLLKYADKAPVEQGGVALGRAVFPGRVTGRRDGTSPTPARPSPGKQRRLRLAQPRLPSWQAYPG